MNICQTFKDLAHKTWAMLATSRAVVYPMQEETFTDLHLLHFKQHHPEIKIVNFTKWQEGQNGADWEWWLKIPDGRWIGYRVQAKVLDVWTESFEQLYYRKDKSSISQCDKLIAEAKADKSNPCIPLYVLYLHSEDYPKYLTNDYGCSLISAYSVRSAKGVKTTALADWKDDLIPWHELICPKLGAGRSWVGSMRRFLDKAVAPPKEKSVGSFITDQPPVYVYQGLNSDYGLIQSDNNSHNIAGAVIFDLSNY
ncbi:DUF6615 family protein [Mucilaginibacter sp. UYCu711]|uniref:DUF6615 family protein n=1 Tax=Mucilaginibacter sp. UYCu711 TaxID=3156339 RepID=UPI003D19967F